MMTMIYKWLKRPLVIIILILIILILFRKINLFDKLFSTKPVIIDNTPLVIKEIRNIAELNTATFQKDIIADSTAPSSIPFAAKREIVLIITGTVVAGIDMKQLNDSAFFSKDDSVHVTLPFATIREVIINPSDVETFYEFGQWKNEEITTLKLSAKGKLLAAANTSLILEKADAKARSVIKQFLMAVGFKKVIVISR